MIVLVANIGSTSFKFRLFDMTDERELVRGGVERIGSDSAGVKVGEQSWTGPIADHDEARHPPGGGVRALRHAGLPIRCGECGYDDRPGIIRARIA